MSPLQEKLQRPELWNDVPLDYNRSWPYNKQLGFHVAVDAAAKLPRSLPVAAVFSLSPPGDNPPYHDVIMLWCKVHVCCIQAHFALHCVSLYMRLSCRADHDATLIQPTTFLCGMASIHCMPCAQLLSII